MNRINFDASAHRFRVINSEKWKIESNSSCFFFFLRFARSFSYAIASANLIYEVCAMLEALLFGLWSPTDFMWSCWRNFGYNKRSRYLGQYFELRELEFEAPRTYRWSFDIINEIEILLRFCMSLTIVNLMRLTWHTFLPFKTEVWKMSNEFRSDLSHSVSMTSQQFFKQFHLSIASITFWHDCHQHLFVYQFNDVTI